MTAIAEKFEDSNAAAWIAAITLCVVVGAASLLLVGWLIAWLVTFLAAGAFVVSLWQGVAAAVLLGIVGSYFRR